MMHNPELIEKEILELIESHIAPSFSKKVYCVDYSFSCLHRNGLHIYIELNSTPSISVLDDIVVLITSHIEKTHSEWTKEVIFFKNGTFPEQFENVPPRFNTSDKVKQKQLNDQIYYSARIDNEEDLDISENCIKEELCQACFHIFETYMDQPLDIETFDILKEWTFNIPLPVCIFFENVFLEISGMNETRKSKIAALYCHFEAMLHKMNKNYTGITQDINTDELLVNYHSVSTVFDVTSHLEEEHVYNIFKQEATWPIYDLWEDLQMNNLITESQQAKENMESNVTETSIDQLNLTLESVHLDDEELNMSIEDLDRSMGNLSVGSQMDRDEVSSQMGTSPNQLNGTLTIPTDEENTVEHNIFRHIEDISISDSDSDTLSLGDEYEIRLEENSENVREIEKMLGAISHIDTEDNDSTLSGEVQKQSFSIFKTNPILTRHPPPASGRDDDIMVLKNVLDDILLKTEHGGNKERILFAPDFKIANNLFKLMDSCPKYRSFLPEFPLLHLRKSKITNLISAYKEAGLIHILQYMKDEENEKRMVKTFNH
ncbi:unnamed protein product [Mytilus coruscus]|uniref:Uncharacterized protein n=1 Tax=Mytilus coruscus TaxID=42192 RepID=A0A6J8CRP2_MYTCO|nr:unnamed protein product [Mytilus coruscus]